MDVRKNQIAIARFHGGFFRLGFDVVSEDTLILREATYFDNPEWF